MRDDEKYFAPDRASWRAWLQANHANCTGVWLVLFKKQVPKPSVRYEEALEEALCFGWIDNLRKRLDNERYVQRFTPRKPNSRWSAFNLKLVERLKVQGLMTEAGLDKMETANSAASKVMRATRAASASLKVPSDFETALAKNANARSYFEALAPSYRRLYLLWIGSAKRSETRARRVKEAVTMLAAGKKLGLK